MEQKALRGKLWKDFCMGYLRRMWEHFTVKRNWAKEVLADAEKDRQEGIQGKWQKGSPFKEELELVKRSDDLSVNAIFNALCILRRKIRQLEMLQARISETWQDQCMGKWKKLENATRRSNLKN